jgi:hypothetical protein
VTSFKKPVFNTEDEEEDGVLNTQAMKWNTKKLDLSSRQTVANLRSQLANRPDRQPEVVTHLADMLCSVYALEKEEIVWKKKKKLCGMRRVGHL